VDPASRITNVFAARTRAGQLAFIPFVTAGDPDLAFTQRLIRELAAAGADLIEVGFPYSDPIADGPVIQSSYTRALNKHVKIAEIFSAVKVLKDEIATPLLAMVSYAIIFRSGAEGFVQKASDSGFAGLIVPDLPGDEAAELAALTQRAGLALVQLVAPTTPPERLARIVQHASGFVYCIAVAGTTGVREALPSELAGMLQQLRKQTTLPLAVGFGIGRPEQVRQLKGLADGAIVGSALVRCFEGASERTSRDSATQRVRELAGSLSEAAHGE
jgi:tryptophan synthase alpha chain